MNKIDVLDHGYVRLVEHMGRDLSVVNAARVSYDKESEELDKRDKGLLNFLAREDHTSPFRHSVIEFEVYAPMIVKNQWYKYVIGSDHQDIGAELSFRDPVFAWNESSRRYITEEPEFYAPGVTEWRSAPANSKQGSGENLPAEDGIDWTIWLNSIYGTCLGAYEAALEAGVAAEQARLFLPAYALYVRWRWTCSLQGVLHFLDQRLAHDAQKEIQLYAAAVHELIKPHWPNAIEAWMKRNDS